MKKNRRKYFKKWRKDNPTKQRSYDLMRNYGITVEDYDKMFCEQNGVCSICGKKETAKNQFGLTKLSVEHRHSDGRVRGLVCRVCNHLIDIYETDFYGLKKEIVEYMEKHNE